RRTRVIPIPEWNAAGNGGAAYARRRLQRIDQSTIELRSLAVERILRRWRRKLEGDQTSRFEAKMHALQPGETLNEQPGADQQHGCQCQFADGEAVTQASADSRVRSARGLLQYF